MLAWAEEQFHRCLVSSPEGEPGRSYLADAASRDETIRRFHLGFAPMASVGIGSSNAPAAANGRPPILERVGLLRRKELGGGYYDWFRGRVMFSIRDARSRPIAFGGRVLPQLADERSAKYINSPETPLFSKSRELYGLDVARENFKNEGGAIVMEGYTDVLMAQQHGITNCVAVLGTALGERHLQLLRRYTDSITLVLDGDAAGRRRTNEILDTLLALFEKNQVDLRILTLPEGIDPCDFIATHGSDPFRQLLAQAVDALEHKFKAVTNGLDTLTDTHRASQAAEQLLATLAQIRPDGGGASSQTLLREEQMLSRIARKFHLPEEKLRSRLTSHAPRRPRQDVADVVAGSAADRCESTIRQAIAARIAELPTWDRDVLELVILDPTLLARVADVIEPAAISLAGRPANLRRLLPPGRADGWHDDFGRLLAAFDEPDMKNLLVQLDESCRHESQGRPRTLVRRLAGNAPPPRRRRRPTAPTSPPPAKAPTTPNNCSLNSVNNPNPNTSLIMKGERSRLDSGS